MWSYKTPHFCLLEVTKHLYFPTVFIKKKYNFFNLAFLKMIYQYDCLLKNKVSFILVLIFLNCMHLKRIRFKILVIQIFLLVASTPHPCDINHKNHHNQVRGVFQEVFVFYKKRTWENTFLKFRHLFAFRQSREMRLQLFSAFRISDI